MQHAHITRLSALALGIAGALAFGQADASGFQLKETASSRSATPSLAPACATTTPRSWSTTRPA